MSEISKLFPVMHTTARENLRVVPLGLLSLFQSKPDPKGTMFEGAVAYIQAWPESEEATSLNVQVYPISAETARSLISALEHALAFPVS